MAMMSPNAHLIGEFFEIFSVIAKHDPTVQDYINKGPKNATYLSPDIQNSIL